MLGSMNREESTIEPTVHGKETAKTAKTAKRRGHLLDAAETRLPKASSQHSEQKNHDGQYLAIPKA
ncbi:hypothetical protein EAF00_000727 [Botryotinia globosa]|nr:hypothetical protein EAF00_000727 [Botryotinia globosa]